MNKKHKKVIELHMLRGLRKKDAYKAVYKNASDLTAESASSKLFAKPQNQPLIDEILNSPDIAGLGRVVRTISDDLEATKEVLGKNDNIIELKDNEMRAKAQEKLLRLHKVEGFTNAPMVDNRQVHVAISKDDIQHLTQVVADLKLLSQSMCHDDGGQSGEVIDV